MAAPEWRRVAPELYRLRLLTPLDYTLLAVYCDAYARWREASAALDAAALLDPETHGLLVTTKDGGVAANPLIWIASNAAKAMVKYATEFGMTPASRSKVSPSLDYGPSKFKGLFDFDDQPACGVRRQPHFAQRAAEVATSFRTRLSRDASAHSSSSRS